MWRNMKATQDLLEKRYIREFDLDMSGLLRERILALTDELLEYAKATKCFKYWSIKSADDIMTRLEEFADGIHFYLDLFNAYEIDDRQIREAEEHPVITLMDGSEKKQITFHITYAILYLMQLHDPLINRDQEQEVILKSFANFWAAGKVDRLNRKDIELAYYRKNKKNHDRQSSGY